jgi:hypothetical protein
MMSSDPLSRRRLIRNSAGLSLGLAALAAGVARAEASKASKADVKYQFTPKDAAKCGDCVSFIPSASSSGAPGTCKAVEGVIPQNGWCVLFSHRK